MSTLLADLKRRAKKIKQEITALYFAYRDPRTPWLARLFCLLVVAYMFSPIDLIPDFIPVLGYLDDLVLVPLGISLALRMIPTAVMEDARQSAIDPQQLKGVTTLFAAIILIFWTLVICIILRGLYQLVTHNT